MTSISGFYFILFVTVRNSRGAQLKGRLLLVNLHVVGELKRRAEELKIDGRGGGVATLSY